MAAKSRALRGTHATTSWSGMLKPIGMNTCTAGGGGTGTCQGMRMNAWLGMEEPSSADQPTTQEMRSEAGGHHVWSGSSCGFDLCRPATAKSRARRPACVTASSFKMPEMVEPLCERGGHNERRTWLTLLAS